ncbi:MAG: hypothetical protein DMF24_07540 [Verrucomicrobia bacterium]|nr:MAG: hypothetical protein DMF24_07540 [Verrucomicrobiota bacterium]
MPFADHGSLVIDHFFHFLMPLKNQLFLIGLLTLLAALIVLWLSPAAVSNGLRLWIWWRSRQEGLIASFDKIDAPFLQPVVIRNLHVKSARADALHIDLNATQVQLDLNFSRILLRRRGHAIRNLSVEDLHGEIRRESPNVRGITKSGWGTLQRLLPQKCSVHGSEMRVQDGATLILLRSGTLFTSESEAGRFSAGELIIASPWLRQTFSQLRGATRWDANRLTLAGLTLARGLDLESVSLDFSRLGSQRVALEFDADVFGGKIRGNIAHEWRSSRYNWKVAGAATDISLAQTSEAIGLTDRIGGLIHASNFTFRGNLAHPADVTASLWTEVTGLTWRNRTAEGIMLGASLYNQQIQLQQLYIKQKTNQLTLSGQASFSSKSSDWLSPDFRGDVAATINNLGDFTTLFGAKSGDFAGELIVEGTLNTRARQLGGNLMIEGTALTLFKTVIDSLSAKLNLKASELEIEQIEMKRKNDSLNGTGKIEMSGEHSYSGTLEARADNLLDYLPGFRRSNGKSANTIPVDVQATITSSNWDARGTLRVSGSGPISFTANFPLHVGTNWSAFQLSPLNITLDFPSIFLSKTPELFHPEIFQDGILSGSISLSETLHHPRIVGDVQLVNGKLSTGSRAWFNLTEASSRIVFEGDRARLEFFNAATKDVDVLVRGEIDFKDTSDITINITGATPIFDLTSHLIDCVNKFEIAPAALPLAPAVGELEFRGSLFQSPWTISVKEDSSSPLLGVSNPADLARNFPLCLGTGAEEKTLLLGALPRTEVAPEASPKRQNKRR